MNTLDKIMGKIEKFMEGIGGFACFLLMMAVVFGVLERYVLKTTLIEGLYNITESWIFTVLAFMALAGSYREGLWPRLETIIDKIPRVPNRAINIVHEIIGIVMYLVIAYFTFRYAIAMTEEGRQFQAGAAQYPVWPFLYLVPLAFFLLSVEVIINLYKLIVKKAEVARATLDE